LTASGTAPLRAPGTADHRAAIVGEPVRAHAGLVGGQEIALVLDRARAAEHVPVGGARGEGEGGRDEENLRAGPNQTAVELREAKIVADGEAEDAELGGHHHGLGPRGARVRLAHGDPPGEIDVEQVHLAIACEEIATGTEETAGVEAAPLARHALEDRSHAEIYPQRPR